MYVIQFNNVDIDVCRRPGVLVLVNDADWELRCVVVGGGGDI